MNLLNRLFMMILLGVTFVNAGGFLMPDEAFKPYAKVNEKMQIETGVVIAQDIYLYDEKLKIKLKNSDGISISKKVSPKTQTHHDSQVYLTSPNFILTLKNNNNVSGIKDVTLIISYQGCSEKGLCYEPNSKEFHLKIDTSKLQEDKTLPTLKKLQVSSKKDIKVSKTDMIANTFKSGNIFLVLLTFFGFGLLLAMTPCVFPMIPIISGLIISQGEDITTKKAFALSVVYVLAMAVAYTIAGVLAGLFIFIHICSLSI